MGRLNLPVYFPLVRRQLIEIQLRCGRQGFDNIFQGILVHAVPEIEKLDGNFRIRQKLLPDIPLAQILADRMVVGKIPVMYQRFIETDKRMGPSGMPHPALGRVALVGDPCVGFEILEFIILNILFGIPDNFENQEVAAVRQNKGPLFTQGYELFDEVDYLVLDEAA